VKQLISVSEAAAMVLEGCLALPAIQANLHEAGYRVLAEDVYAKRTQPPFPAAAMDGYAVADADAQWAKANAFGYSPAHQCRRVLPL
jgi:molybdopterin molybdotransferase